MAKLWALVSKVSLLLASLPLNIFFSLLVFFFFVCLFVCFFFLVNSLVRSFALHSWKGNECYTGWSSFQSIECHKTKINIKIHVSDAKHEKTCTSEPLLVLVLLRRKGAKVLDQLHSLEQFLMWCHETRKQGIYSGRPQRRQTFQWTYSRRKMREDMRQRVMVGFGFTSDRSKSGASFFRPITKLRAIFTWVSQVLLRLLWFSITTFSDWLKKLASLSQPFRSKT